MLKHLGHTLPCSLTCLSHPNFWHMNTGTFSLHNFWRATKQTLSVEMTPRVVKAQIPQILFIHSMLLQRRTLFHRALLHIFLSWWKPKPREMAQTVPSDEIVRQHSSPCGISHHGSRWQRFCPCLWYHIFVWNDLQSVLLHSLCGEKGQHLQYLRWVKFQYAAVFTCKCSTHPKLS